MPHSISISRMAAAASVLAALAGCSPADDTSGTSKASASVSVHGAGFDAARAFELLKAQVRLGPRVPNSPGHAAGAAFIQQKLHPYAESVTVQDFTAKAGGKPLALRNIIARFNSNAQKHVLLAAHWDTRPTADCEVTAEKRRQPIPGANDGASGVAVLLELARILHERPPRVGVVMVFFDGEDYGPGAENMFLGSRYFASSLGREKSLPQPENILYGILLDMIGDSNLTISKEPHSFEAAPEVMDRIWAVARRMGYAKVFSERAGRPISDDHLPLIDAGVKCVDLIDFDYGPWHTLDDTPDKCSAESLKTVGEVVAAVVYSDIDR